MRRTAYGCLVLGLLAGVFRIDAGAAPAAADAPPRLANGVVIEGVVSQATPEGLLMQTPKGAITYPWKYLSPGTRHRFELPMLAEMKAKAEVEAKAAAAKAAAARKAAEAKAAKEAAAKAAQAAAATNKPTATNAAPAVAK